VIDDDLTGRGEELGGGSPAVMIRRWPKSQKQSKLRGTQLSIGGGDHGLNFHIKTWWIKTSGANDADPAVTHRGSAEGLLQIFDPAQPLKKRTGLPSRGYRSSDGKKQQTKKVANPVRVRPTCRKNLVKRTRGFFYWGAKKNAVQ